jgi:hypothetical protein
MKNRHVFVFMMKMQSDPQKKHLAARLPASSAWQYIMGSGRNLDTQ